jgi:flavin reductase (DIM6/NTAB) family NADH-FMN oxidoreductase RutF
MSVSVDEFRALMRHFPSGVAVVTSIDGQGCPVGFTCSALCSVSFDPPVLLICVNSRSQTLLTIESRGVFAVNLLHDGGRSAAEAFASRAADRFAGLRWWDTPRWSLPALLEHAHAVAECRVLDLMPAGDHVVVLGEVIETMNEPRLPLLYGLGGYSAWPRPEAGGANGEGLCRSCGQTEAGAGDGAGAVV